MSEQLYALTDNAYLPTDVPEPDYTNLGETLAVLYGEAPCYAPVVTSEGKVDLSAETPYVKQLFSLIDKLSATLLEYTADHTDVTAKDYINPATIEANVTYLKTELRKVNYATGNATIQAAYYQTYKDNIEKIYFLTKDWTSNRKYKFINRLIEKIAVCSAGAHTVLCDALYELTQKPSVLAWLADLRKTLVTTYAEIWIQDQRILNHNSIHTHFFCNKVAHAEGWNLPGFTVIPGFQDWAEFWVGDTQSLRHRLRNYIRESYNALSIRDNLVLNYNAMLADYDNVIITPDQNTSLQLIFAPFIEHQIFLLDSLYDYSSGEWRINPSFKNQLPEFVIRLLLKEGLITSIMPTIFRDRISPLINREIARLREKYADNDERVSVLTRANTDLEVIALNHEKMASQVAKEISDYIQNPPFRNSLNKYPAFWEQVTLLLLNVLMALPFAVPGAIKYATTGHFFFSHNGRSLDEIDDLAQGLSYYGSIS